MRVISLWLLLVLLAGCRKAMQIDGRIKPLQESTFFEDGMTAREPVAGTVARGELFADTLYWKGEVNGYLANGIPEKVNLAVLKRGQDRFNIYCAVCHGRTGDGDGMIVARGFPQPPSYHQKRLRDVPPGYIFGVMTHGYGVMYSYADRVPVPDRWAIVAYIRALQLSQNARAGDVPEEELKRLEGQ